MTVYVDECQVWRRGTGLWCHMMTDSDDLSELHAMAAAIGLKREWFQDKPRFPHYDLRPASRALALARGAVAVDSIELVTRCRREEPKADPAEKRGAGG
jgi:hypothetical protein